MKNLKTLLGLVITITMVLSSCGKEELTAPTTSAQEEATLDLAQMETTPANIDELVFEMEEGILVFPSIEELQTYLSEVSIMPDEERQVFEQENGFTSLRTIVDGILSESENIESEGALEAYLEENQDYIYLDESNSISSRVSDLSILLNEQGITKIGSVYHYYGTDMVIAANNMESLLEQMSNPSVPMEGVMISYAEEMPKPKPSEFAEDLKIDNTFNCYAGLTKIDETLEYKNSEKKKRRLRLEARFKTEIYYVTDQFGHITFAYYFNYFYYKLRHQKKFWFAWVGNKNGILAEYKIGGYNYSNYQWTKKIERYDSNLNLPSGTSLHYFDHIMGSTGSPWQRVGCK